MLAAYLVTRANESDVRQGGVRGGSGGGVEAAPAPVPRPEGGAGGAGGKGLSRSSATTAAAAAAAARAESDADSLENLAAFVSAGEGARWRSDWPEEDRAAFRKGVFAFRRDFHRVRAAFLPHKPYGDVVEYFYR